MTNKIIRKGCLCATILLLLSISFITIASSKYIEKNNLTIGPTKNLNKNIPKKNIDSSGHPTKVYSFIGFVDDFGSIYNGNELVGYWFYADNVLVKLEKHSKPVRCTHQELLIIDEPCKFNYKVVMVYADLDEYYFIRGRSLN